MNAFIYIADKNNPWINLAIESALFDLLNDDEICLYLWQNENTIVIGRNQNAWRECRVEKFLNEGGHLSRRPSGGGAVYQDMGNLNFTFIAPKNIYNVHRQLKVIVNAVNSLGINAEFSGRNDILAEGRKFSGNAFYSSKEKAMHHGTILIDTNFKKLSDYLQVSQAKMKSKGVKSVKSRVINLKMLKQDLTVEMIKKALIESFNNEYGVESKNRPIIDLYETEAFKEYYDRYSSKEWIFGKSPDFDVVHETRFDWGEIEIGLTIKSGKIKQCKVYSDAMDADTIEGISRILGGLPFNTLSIIGEIQKLDNDEIAEDLTEWIKSWKI
ncbi:MAG: lipoate--protein ligase [Kosmotoga sp.]|nr:MAG: lipoate--protein ligase [Kosmotoga sp.]